MTYQQFISNNLRPFVNDLEVLTRDSWNGDGTTVAFRTTNRPILENSYTVKVGGTAKTETTHYTIDRKTGMITFTSGNEPGSGSDNVTLDYKYVVIDDTDWLEIIKNRLRMWRDKMWTEAIDSTTLSSVAKQNDYSMDSISTRVKAIVYIQFRSSSNVEWVDLGRDTNVKFFKEQNKFNIRPYLEVAGYAFRIRYLEYFEDDVALTGTIAFDNKYLTPFQYGCGAEFLDRKLIRMTSDVGMKVTKDTYEPINSMRGIRNDWAKQAELIIGRVRPIRPSIAIPTVIDGVKT